MCYEAPGPRCSGHTRTNFRKAKENLVNATADLKQKQKALESAKTEEAKTALEESIKTHQLAVAELNVATSKYEASKLYRAEAMEAYRKAREEYNASPEGIKKNRVRSVDTRLTEEQRGTARREAIEGQATRNRQKEAYEFKKALDEAQSMQATSGAMSPEEKIAALTRAVDDDPSLDDSDKMRARSKILRKVARESSDLAVLNHLANDVDEYGVISQNPHASAEILEMLRSKHGGNMLEEMTRGIARHPNTAQETLDSVWKYQESQFENNAVYPSVKNISGALAGNPNMSPKTLSRMASVKYVWPGGYGLALGSNPALAPKDMERVMSSSDEGKIGVASNRKTPEELLREISKTRKQAVFAALISNPATPKDVLEKIARTKGSDSWLSIAGKAQERLLS